MSRPPSLPATPRWVRWALGHLLDEGEHRVVMDELADLHEALLARVGAREARRRYLRQLRHYPLRLLAHRLGSALSSASPAGGQLTQAARSLARAPGLTATVVLTVGVGIAGCTAIFAVVDALYLQPLPYPDVARLDWIYTDAPPNRWPLSVVDFRALQEQQTSFDAVAAVRRGRRTLTTADGVDVVRVLEATPGLLEVWGIAPVEGRTPTAAEGGSDAPPTVLVTSGFARLYLDVGDGDPGRALGRTVTLDGVAYQVIGILPPSLGPMAKEFQVVPTLRLQTPTRKGPFFLQVFGRLRPGVSPQAAHQELRRINQGLFPLWADSYQDRNASWGLAGVTPLVRGDQGSLLGVLMGAVGMVLLIALANAANLLIARAGARRREMAVRTALGASRGRIRTHLLMESGLLAMGSVVVGLAAARLCIAALPVVASAYLVRVDEARLGGHTVAFALALAVVGAALFTLVPLLHGRRERNLAGALRSGDRASTAGAGHQRSQRLLVAGQLAVVVPLLAGALLLLASFARLKAVDPGFDASKLVSMQVHLSPAAYPDAAGRRQFWGPALSRLSALPGVEGVALSSERPPDDVFDINNFDLEDRPTPPGQPERVAPWVVVDLSYFEVMGIPALEGRTFLPSDLDDDAPPVVVVDRAWARRNYPGESPVGKRLYSGGQTSGPRTTIVGVVGSVPYQGIGSSPLGAMYQPSPEAFGEPWLVVRTSGRPDRVAGEVRQALSSLAPESPVTGMATGADLLDASLTEPRHLSLLLAVFSTVALLLAVVGVYGITSYSVQQRRGDIAVRLALGGSPRTVLATTLWDGMRVSLAGLVVGLTAAFLLTRLLAGLLYGVAPRDPLALTGAGLLLLLVSAVACLVPARRAVGVDPASSLREE